MRQVRVSDITGLFSKDILIYSMFDIQLRQPLQVIRIVYFAIFAGLIGVPIIAIFGFNAYSAMTGLGIPFFLSGLMAKPIFEGRNLIAWAKSNISYLLSPKYYYDNSEGKLIRKHENVEQVVLVSRHKDYNKLFQQELKESGGLYE